MRIPRRTVARSLCLVVAMIAAGCGSDDESAATTVTDTLAPVATTSTSIAATIPPPVETTTTAPQITTAAPVTTPATPPTTVAAVTTVADTTTTVALGAGLTLDDDGIGDAVFGDDPDLVVSTVVAVLGEPSEDSGWIDAIARTCPGTEARFVRWGGLTLTFGDESSITSGSRHFSSWSFGPPDDVVQAPAGLATPAGIRLGSTVADVGRAYPSASLFGGDDLGTASVQINDNLFAYVTSIEESGVVTAMVGGQGCGG